MKEHCDPVFGFPQLVRFSWSTAQKILDDDAYHVEWEEVDDKPQTPANNTSISSFFKVTKQKGTDKIKHEFFRQRFLQSCVDM